MSRRLALAWAPLLMCWAGPNVLAQSPASGGVVPTRTSLSRLGLERQWITTAPVAGSEQVLRISRGPHLLFVQTDAGMLHAMEVETGRPVWSAQIGERATRALPVSQNSFAVFATSANMMTALDRNTGRVIWRSNLDVLPSSGTTADEERVLVGLGNGMVRCYDLKERKEEKGPETIRVTPKLSWQVATGGPIHTRPVLADRIACFGSSDQKVYVQMSNEATPLFRISTGGPIGEELGTYKTRTLLVPSADNDLYAVDVLTSKVSWTYPTGAPLSQGPIVAQDEIFVINHAGTLSNLDAKDGQAKWTTPTDEGRLLGVSPTKAYLVSQDNDLMIVARDSGKVLMDPAATYQRAGLNLRPFTLSFPERYDDRLYLATPDGVLLCLREVGATEPRPLHDPNDKPFGYIPPEGIKEPIVPVEEAPADPTEPGADAAPSDAPQN